VNNIKNLPFFSHFVSIKNMNQVEHIQKNKEFLDLRWQILRLIREFFWSQNFIEVETPVLLRLPGQEPYLSPMKLSLHDETGKEYTGFLHTSPEYAMKKMLAAGYEKIFSLCKVFRDYESFGGTHNPEFTMIEWYRTNSDFWKIMDDVGGLFAFISDKLGREKKFIFERMHMRDVWKKYIGVNLDDYLTREKMYELCMGKGYNPAVDEPYEDLFYRIFLNEIEPKLETVIIHHYPKQMAALAKMSETELGYAERFEVYVGGLEIANAFGELTDAREQKKRFEEEYQKRQELGKDLFGIDADFIDAVGQMPSSGGIALGVDRLVQLFASCQNIDSVLVLPASKLFN
jgi:lysyl-tRNA synthetase class 2